MEDTKIDENDLIIFKKILNILKKNTLSYDKPNIFDGQLFYNNIFDHGKFSLQIIKNDTKKTYGFILQIHSKVHKIKPFTSEHCIINSRGLLSNKDGFFLQYDVATNELIFYTTNSHHIIGKALLLDKETLKKNKNKSSGSQCEPYEFCCGRSDNHSCENCNCGKCISGYLGTFSPYRLTKYNECCTKCHDCK